MARLWGAIFVAADDVDVLRVVVVVLGTCRLDNQAVLLVQRMNIKRVIDSCRKGVIIEMNGWMVGLMGDGLDDGCVMGRS
jgi:hypothetical protein